MVISSAFADRGGLATYSTCTYRLFSNDTIPEVGEQLCGRKHQWWKNECAVQCSCKPKHGNCEKKLLPSSYRAPLGIIVSLDLAENGERQVKAQSFSQLLTGDRISTTHGQKGVVRILDQRNLPMVVAENFNMPVDLYMTASSVTSRQTLGQLFESTAGIKVLKEGIRDFVPDTNFGQVNECKRLLDGITGEIMTYIDDTGRRHVLKASYGCARVFNQTQLTRERHHLTHNTECKYSLSTSSGRAAGGGVATSEMDFHAMYTSGLLNCSQEILDRGNKVRVL